MASEKRAHPRFLPKGLHTNIVIDTATHEDCVSIGGGEIVDMSYSGVKFKLPKPLHIDFFNRVIRLMIIMPQSCIPISVHGNIKHFENNFEYGLEFTKTQNESIIDDLMFECIKYSEHSIEI